MKRMSGHSGGSGPHSSGRTKPSGHVDSVMGRQYPSMMSVRGKGVGTGTTTSKKNRKLR